MKNPSDYTAHLHPGKFEGESPATEYFYEQMLNGDGGPIFGHDDEEVAVTFHIWSDESKAFNLPIGHYFLLWEDSHGFVYGKIYPSRKEAVNAFTSKRSLPPLA